LRKIINRSWIEISSGFRRIRPTKPELDKLKKRRAFADKGKHLLDIKRQQIIFRLQNILEDFFKQRKVARDKLISSYSYLNKCYKQFGKRRIQLMSELNRIHYETNIEVKFYNQIGIDIPKINLEITEKEKLPSYSFQDTPIVFDLLIKSMENAITEIVKLAQLDYELFHLASSYQKIQRRINALDSIIIPELDENIKVIEEILEDLEREELIQIHEIKDKLEEEL